MAVTQAAACALLGGLLVTFLPVPLGLAVLLSVLIAVAVALYRPRWRPAAAGLAIGAVVWGGVLVWILSQLSVGLDSIG